MWCGNAKFLFHKADRRWGMLGKKDCNRLVNVICNDSYAISGRGVFKEEFVTCGGIDLKSVSLSTLESRHVPHLFFAGEVLDVDGVTGGFNFQAAWTTAYVVAEQIAKGMRNSSFIRVRVQGFFGACRCQGCRF